MSESASECPSPKGLSDISDTGRLVRNGRFGRIRTFRTGHGSSTQKGDAADRLSNPTVALEAGADLGQAFSGQSLGDPDCP